MDVKLLPQNLKKRIEKILKMKIIQVLPTRQGMDSNVFMIRTDIGKEMIIKISTSVKNDFIAINLIKNNRIDIKVPEIFCYLENSGEELLVMEKINSIMFEDMPDKENPLYLISMIDTLKKIHTIKSHNISLEGNNKLTWKDYLLGKLEYESSEFNWSTIMKRDGVDNELIGRSIESIRKKIVKENLVENNYSLIHTDFNQRNLFVDANSHKINYVIDWSEAMFGDPLYDFARIRMLIWHFNLGEKTEKAYFDYLNLNDQEKYIEELYLYFQILIYINWYSETKNDFNDSRLGLHQLFLRRYLGNTII